MIREPISHANTRLSSAISLLLLATHFTASSLPVFLYESVTFSQKWSHKFSGNAASLEIRLLALTLSHQSMLQQWLRNNYALYSYFASHRAPHTYYRHAMLPTTRITRWYGQASEMITARPISFCYVPRNESWCLHFSVLTFVEFIYDIDDTTHYRHLIAFALIILKAWYCVRQIPKCLHHSQHHACHSSCHLISRRHLIIKRIAWFRFQNWCTALPTIISLPHHKM